MKYLEFNISLVNESLFVFLFVFQSIFLFLIIKAMANRKNPIIISR